MPILVVLLHTLYVVSVLGLALYGFQAIWLTLHYLRRDRNDEGEPLLPDTWPAVAVHLPIYNERHVADRVIRACTRLEYPQDRLTIRVLDDSDDATSALVNLAARKARDDGFDVRVLRRPSREGYKAGALAYAMEQENADFIALFDADFLPASDFLKRTMPWFFHPGNEHVGFVQTRWGHLNRDNSFLTRCQAVALDGHFVVEQGGRQAAGFAFGFNGSGGVWRRACIEDPAVGGWQADTLCEDLDLSYRAQLAGWKGRYLNDVESPAEIPPQLLAFKRQQFRWAKGSIQTLLKIGPRVLQSEWSPAKRFAAFLHLGAYLLHPMLLALLLIALPLALVGVDPAAPLAVLSLTSLGPPILYAIGQRRLYGSDWLRGFLLLPLLMLLGTGLSLSNSVAALQALFGTRSEFLRTPKFHATDETNHWQGSAYRLRLQPVMFAELVLAAYALLTSVIVAHRGNLWTAAFVAIYALGFGLMSIFGLWQEWNARAAVQRPRPAVSVGRESSASIWPPRVTQDR